MDGVDGAIRPRPDGSLGGSAVQGGPPAAISDGLASPGVRRWLQERREKSQYGVKPASDGDAFAPFFFLKSLPMRFLEIQGWRFPNRSGNQQRSKLQVSKQMRDVMDCYCMKTLQD